MRRRPLQSLNGPHDAVNGLQGAEKLAADDSTRKSREGQQRKPKTGAATRKEKKERPYTTERVGIWEMEREIFTWRDRLPFSRVLEDWQEIAEALPYVLRFIKELVAIGPLFSLAYLFLRVAQAILPAYRMRTAARTIRITQQAVEDRALDTNVLLSVFGQQVLIVVVSRCLDWSVQRITEGLSYRLRRIFEAHTLRARFKLDLPTLEDENTARELRIITGRGGSERAWHALQSIVNAGANVIETATSFMLLLSMLKESRGDRLIACVALLKPTLEAAVSDQFYQGNYWAKIVDMTARRVENLKHIAHQQRFYKDIIAFSLGDYIVDEFTTSSDALNATQTLHTPFNRQRAPLSPSVLLLRLADDLPLFVLALQAIHTPKHVPLSFASFTLIRQTTSELSRKVLGMARGRGPAQSLAQHAGTIRSIYDATSLPVQIVDGSREYERNADAPGMAIELRNVSFRYAGQEKDVLRNISCSIPSGALVMILGSNGGGKSSLMKLLTRLHDADEGEILVNGHSIREYRADSLRKATAALWQDHQVMPLTAAENIGVGDTGNVSDSEAIRQAATRAGCRDFIEAMPNGFDTYLGLPDVGNGRVRTTGWNRPAFLRKQAAQQEREVKLSGGQLQKLALARVLMREEQADLFLFDEPSASLDARAERDLFLRIQALRGRKTVIWVSHRLHLAKQADLVIMVDGGEIKEMGSPSDLLKDPTSTFAELYRFQSE